MKKHQVWLTTEECQDMLSVFDYVLARLQDRIRPTTGEPTDVFAVRFTKESVQRLRIKFVPDMTPE